MNTNTQEEIPTKEAAQKCADWLVNCLNNGWGKSDLGELEKLWWRYHDKKGNFIPSQPSPSIPVSGDSTEAVDWYSLDKTLLIRVKAGIEGLLRKKGRNDILDLLGDDLEIFNDDYFLNNLLATSSKPTEEEKCNGNCGMKYCDEYGCIENKTGNVPQLESSEIEICAVELLNVIKRHHPQMQLSTHKDLHAAYLNLKNALSQPSRPAEPKKGIDLVELERRCDELFNDPDAEKKFWSWLEKKRASKVEPAEQESGPAIVKQVTYKVVSSEEPQTSSYLKQ